MSDSDLKFYVIGDPISHSLSPVMQQYFFDIFKISSKYVAKRVSAEELDKVIKSFIKAEVTGINVTTPHKKEILKYINELSPEAETIGSVNTIKIEQDKLIGHNTDAIGFQTSLRMLNYSFRDKNAIIFGAGGAARAVVVALMREQCNRIIICNRNLERAARLVEDFSEPFSAIELAALPIDSTKLDKIIKTSSLFVNATTVGMGNTINNSILTNTNNLHQDLLVYDLVYRPYKTKLIQQAESYGVRWMNGLDMLILQGIESLKFWIEQDLMLDSSSYAEIKNLLWREICQE